MAEKVECGDVGSCESTAGSFLMRKGALALSSFFQPERPELAITQHNKLVHTQHY